MENVQALRGGALTRPEERVAPDLSRYRRSRRRCDHPYEQAEAQQAEARAKARAKLAHKRKMRLSLPGTLFIAIAFALILYIVYTYMQLSELSKETSRLQTSLTAIRQENLQMQARAENTMKLSDLARIASEMGMVLPDREDIVYLDLSGSDHAVILDKPNLWDSLVGAVGSLAAKAHEYFL